MTVEAQRPTGNPGTAPRGPAGPAPEPHGPKTPTRPTEPPPPSSPKQQAADILALIDEHLFALGMAALALPEPSNRVETCGVEILKFRLRRARAAVADLLKYSGRDGKDIAAAVASRPVQPPVPAGERLAPGYGAAFSGAVTESDAAVVAGIAGAQLATVETSGPVRAEVGAAAVVNPAGRPPPPGGDFLLPRDVRAPLSAALNRRAD